MVEYDDKILKYKGTEYNLKGLKPVQVIWHLQEMNRPGNLLDNLNGKYTMPDKLHNISLVEGTTFDALLVDDKLFRYTKLDENDMNEIQEYLNKYAYATALVKLNECANVIGSGLKSVYDLEEVYTFISKTYDKLLENVIVTKEQGRLVENFSDKLEIREGIKNYIRKSKDIRVVENWENNYSNKRLRDYFFEGVEPDGDNILVKFIDKDGSKYEAIYENTNIKLVQPGINLSSILKGNNLVESYKVGILKEYKQPFTIQDATILSYEDMGSYIKLFMLDAYGNRGYVPLYTKISTKDFIKKYKPLMDEAIEGTEFFDNVETTSDFLNACTEDVDRFGRLKNLEVVETDDERSKLQYQLFGYIPNGDKMGDVIWIDPKNKTQFKLSVLNKEGKEYNMTYKYTGDDIKRDIYEVEGEIDDYDFTSKSDVIAFYQRLSRFGKALKAYPTGISTMNRNLKRKEVKEEVEGVQTGDIAPKVDQNVGLVQVGRFKKRKKLKESITKLSKINEQDEFYNSRGFIKDEKGRYHFGDYYINESGKVVHKSKLNEGYFSKLDIKNKEDNEAFEKWKEENSDKIAAYYTQTYSKDLKNINQEIWNSIAKDIYDEERLPGIINKDIKESFNPTGYTNAIRAIGAGIENDEDTEALQKYLQDIIGYCRSIAEDYGVLVEEADFNDVTNIEDILGEVKSIISGLVRKYKDKYPGFCTQLTDVYLKLTEIKNGVYNKLNEARHSFKDTAGANGIHSYFDMVYGQEPDSEYAKIVQKYMDEYDRIFYALEDLKDRANKGEIEFNSPEYNKEYDKLIADYEKADLLFKSAEKIPVESRGKMYQDYLKIDKANDDEFAQARGYKDYKDYSNKLFGLKESNWEEKCEKIFRKYRDEFDSIHEVYDLCDYINRLYDEGGMKKVDDEFFLPGASKEYKKDFKSLINDNKLKESSNPELDRVLNEIKQEMHDQDTGVYDITSNDENEMYKFIDRAVKPILAKSSLDENLKKEIAGWMEADIRDNKRWSIRTGVKAIMDWYKVK